MTYPTDDFEAGESTGLSEHLNSEFALVGGAVDDLAAAVAEGNEALHGHGKETGGCGLTTGTGLSCVLGVGFFWVGGVRYEVAEAEIIVLDPSQTSYLYMDAEGAVTAYVSAQSPNPTGTWFLGTATTDGTTCTAVDDSGADTIAALGDLGDRMTAAEADVAALESDVDALDGRVTTLESGGGGGGTPIYADGIARASDNPETVGQKFVALDAEIDALEEAGTGGGNVVALPALPWDADAVNQAFQLQAQTDADNLAAAGSQMDTIQIKWGVYGDGTGETPDFVDRVNSTWLPA